MARVLPIHQFVMTRDKKPTTVAVAGEKNSAAAAGDVDVKKMDKHRTIDMLKFNNDIVRVLKQVDPELTITVGAAEVMNGILSNMMLDLVHRSFKNSIRYHKQRKKSKLSLKDIGAAVVEVFPPPMAKLARQAALKALATRGVSRLSATMDRTMSIK